MTEIKEKKTRQKKQKINAPSFLEEHPDAKDQLQLIVEDFSNKAKDIIGSKGYSSNVKISFDFFKE